MIYCKIRQLFCYSPLHHYSNHITAYILQSEGQAEEWHGHVTTLTVSPQFRRLGIAHTLMNQLEKISEVSTAWDHSFYQRFVIDNAICLVQECALGHPDRFVYYCITVMNM